MGGLALLATLQNCYLKIFGILGIIEVGLVSGDPGQSRNFSEIHQFL